MILEFYRQIFEKKNETSNFTKIRPVGAELFHGDGQKHRRMDGRADRQNMKKLIVAFRALSCFLYLAFFIHLILPHNHITNF